MSRSGYVDDDDLDNWQMIRWAGAVNSAIRGKRGQAFLREMIGALMALHEHKLYADELEWPAPPFVPPELITPHVCAIGAVGLQRGTDMREIDPYDIDRVAETFGIAPAMAREIMWMNDGDKRLSPAERWCEMIAWARRNIIAGDV